MNKHDYIIEVRQEVFRLVNSGKKQKYKDTDASIEYCYYNKMSVDEAVKTFIDL